MSAAISVVACKILILASAAVDSAYEVGLHLNNRIFDIY